MGILKKFLNKNNTDLTIGNNSSALNLKVEQNTAIIDSGKIGEGAALPLTIKTNSIDRLTVDLNGNVIVNNSTLSTNATSGFLWIPSCNGAPIGSPVSPYTNAAALVMDTVNDNLVLRSGSKWVTTAKLTGEGSNLGWNDITADIMVKGSGTNDPTWTTFRNNISAYSMSASVLTQCWLVFHVRHDYALGTPIHLHTHWSTNGTNTGICRWGFEYTIAKGHQQDAFGATSTVYVEQAATGTIYTHMVAETAAIYSDKLEPDSLVLVRVFRDAANSRDTLSNSVFLFAADMHYQCDRVATKNRIPNFYQ